MAVGVALCEPDGRIINVNQRLCDLIGKTREQVSAELYGGQIHSDDEPARLAAIHDVLSGRTSEYIAERRYVRAGDGVLLWLRLTVSAASSSLGQPKLLVAIVEDVSDRKAQEVVLTETAAKQQKLAALSRSLPGALCIYRQLSNGDTRTEFITPSFEDVLGYVPAAQDSGGSGNFTGVHRDDIAGLITSISESAHIKQPWRAEYRVNHPRKGLIYIVEASAPELDPDGSTVWYCFMQDVTAQKLAEQKLDEQNLLAAAVFENSQEAIVITGLDGRVKAVNPSFRIMSGLGTAALPKGKPLVRLLRANLDTYRHIVRSVSDLGTWQGEATVRNMHGVSTPQWVVVSTVRDATGNPVNYVVSSVDISRIKKTEMQLNQLALHDTLTGLPNRLLLHRRLTTAIEKSRQADRIGAVLFIDLDRFKTVNDSLGHQAGDELLRSVARRLTDRVRGGDTVSRLGGDEFVVVLNGIDDLADAAKVASDIITLIEEPVAISGGREVYVSASIGVSYFPRDGNRSDDLLQRADTALYLAKESGRGTHRVYDVAFTVAANAKLETESRMRRALQRGEYTLHYQPIIDVKRNAIIGVEALIRWNDPLHGFVQPMSFIPLAEETGFIVPLGEWVIRTACAQFMEWKRMGMSLDMLSINLSARQFRLSDLPQRVAALVDEAGIDPSVIKFEITESALMDGGAEALAKLDALKAIGIRLAIDDFGTGYSSLSCLKRFPLDTLKVDRSFVRDVCSDPTAKQITLAVISLAKTLNLKLVAEGVETVEQAALLTSEGCDMVQGFYYSKPLEPGELVEWISAQRSHEKRLKRAV